ncbi:unnamed protein product [Euphydryas editha]|uniref:Uncharacterized protein n=1 Tax=Euphydryas editha TaxID=104508 RepID=A0AAU9VEK5_EUPED|nr:unnamed protein product [Euphydryas editha]
MGVVRDIPTDWSLDEIIENPKVPSGIGKIIKARRINKKKNGQWVPRMATDTIALKVEVYKYPTVQCLIAVVLVTLKCSVDPNHGALNVVKPLRR